MSYPAHPQSTLLFLWLTVSVPVLQYNHSFSPEGLNTEITALSFSFSLSRIAQYEGGAVCSQARSLWRLEPLRIRWVPPVCIINWISFPQMLPSLSIKCWSVSSSSPLSPCSSVAGVAVTQSGVHPSVCVTLPLGTTCAWMRRKAWWCWTQSDQTQNCLPSVSGWQRSEHHSFFQNAALCLYLRINIEYMLHYLSFLSYFFMLPHLFFTPSSLLSWCPPSRRRWM